MAVLLPLLLLGLSTVTATVAPLNSLEPPFGDVDDEGKRTVKGWRQHGHTEVYENFVRLTPDRQSKRGGLWNSHKIGTSEFVTTIRFRISGQGKRLFGDGMAVWFNTNPMYQAGSLFGHTDKFTGFAVLFDTFKNTDAGHVHRDISLLASDGTKLASDLLDVEPARPGCDSAFRYHEGRADFSVANTSLARIAYRQGSVRVLLDEFADGNWRECFHAQNIDVPPTWTNDAYMGLSASTGALADNHDVLSVVTRPYHAQDMTGNSGDAHDKRAEQREGAEPILRKAESQGVAFLTATQVAELVRKERAAMEGKLRHMHHHMEHQLTAVNDAMKHAILKVKKAEAGDHKAIAELERKLQTLIHDHLNDVRSGINKIGVDMHAAVEKVSLDVDDKVTSNTGSWKMPFFLLVVALCVLVAVAFRHYKKLIKSHLL